MALIKDGKIAENIWRFVTDDEALTGVGNLVVTFDRWQENKPDLAGYNDRLGIRLRSDQGPDLIADDLERFDLIELEFPILPDGRAFSYARLLRVLSEYELEATMVFLPKSQIWRMGRKTIVASNSYSLKTLTLEYPSRKEFHRRVFFAFPVLLKSNDLFQRKTVMS